MMDLALSISRASHRVTIFRYLQANARGLPLPLVLISFLIETRTWSRKAKQVRSGRVTLDAARRKPQVIEDT